MNPNTLALIERVNDAKLDAHDDNWQQLAGDLAERLHTAGRGRAANIVGRSKTAADFRTQCGRVVAGLLSGQR